MSLVQISFYQRFRADILSGRKTITIRDESEKELCVNAPITVFEFETGEVFCTIQVLSIEPIIFDELNEVHAQQENMSLPELKKIIGDIYPNISQFYVISFQLIADA